MSLDPMMDPKTFSSHIKNITKYYPKRTAERIHNEITFLTGTDIDYRVQEIIRFGPPTIPELNFPPNHSSQQDVVTT